MAKQSGEARDERLIELTLSTVGDGEAEAQFQERLIQAAEILSDASRYKGANAVAVRIITTVELERDLETGFYRVSVPGVKLAEPKKRPIVTGAYLRENGFMVEKAAEQLSILRPVSKTQEEED